MINDLTPMIPAMWRATPSFPARCALLVALIALAACSERVAELPPAPRLAPTTLLRSSTGLEIILDCPSIPTIKKRVVSPGIGNDTNGNGIVCDRTIGVGSQPLVITTDDVLMPRPMTPRMLPGNPTS